MHWCIERRRKTKSSWIQYQRVMEGLKLFKNENFHVCLLLLRPAHLNVEIDLEVVDIFFCSLVSLFFEKMDDCVTLFPLNTLETEQKMNSHSSSDTEQHQSTMELDKTLSEEKQDELSQSQEPGKLPGPA